MAARETQPGSRQFFGRFQSGLQLESQSTDFTIQEILQQTNYIEKNHNVLLAPKRTLIFRYTFIEVAGQESYLFYLYT